MKRLGTKVLMLAGIAGAGFTVPDGVIAAPADGAPIVPEGSPFQDFFDDFGGPGRARRPRGRRRGPA